MYAVSWLHTSGDQRDGFCTFSDCTMAVGWVIALALVFVYATLVKTLAWKSILRSTDLEAHPRHGHSACLRRYLGRDSNIYPESVMVVLPNSSEV